MATADPRKLLITGIGRSGSGYMARLLTESGVECGHERVWDTGGSRPWPRALAAESSWCAVPFLPLDDVVVLHLVRNPIDWLASWSQTVWSSVPTKRFLIRHTGIDWVAESARDPTDAAMRLYVLWHRMLEPHVTMRLRVEDVDARALDTLHAVVGAPARNADAIRLVPRNVNARRHGTVTWAGVRDLPHAQQFAQVAAANGYDVMPKLRGGAGI